MGGLPLEDPLIIICYIIGSVFSGCQYLTPVLIFYGVVYPEGRNMIEELSPAPYMISLFTCMLKITYAFINTSGSKYMNIVLLIINIIGFSFNTIYITIYLFYSRRKVTMYTGIWIMILDVGLFSLILLLTLLLWGGQERVHVFGWIYLICLSICAIISPSSTIFQVIKTKSIKYMQFYDLLLSTLASTSWLIYSILIENNNIMVPNIWSLMFSLIQMGFYMKYKVTDIGHGSPEEIAGAGKVDMKIIAATIIA